MKTKIKLKKKEKKKKIRNGKALEWEMIRMGKN